MSCLFLSASCCLCFSMSGSFCFALSVCHTLSHYLLSSSQPHVVYARPTHLWAAGLQHKALTRLKSPLYATISCETPLPVSGRHEPCCPSYALSYVFTFSLICFHILPRGTHETICLSSSLTPYVSTFSLTFSLICFLSQSSRAVLRSVSRHLPISVFLHMLIYLSAPSIQCLYLYLCLSLFLHTCIH